LACPATAVAGLLPARRLLPGGREGLSLQAATHAASLLAMPGVIYGVITPTR